MTDEIKTNIWIWVTAICVVIGIFFILNSIFPIIIINSQCYKDIAEEECLGQEIYYSENTPFAKPKFTCCKNATQETRWFGDNILDCMHYVFFEEDHIKCSDKYYWFGLKKVD